MAMKDEPTHHWPEEEVVRRPPPEKLGRLARIGRFLAGAFVLAGVSKGMTGTKGASADRAAANVILFGEGDALGHEANRTSE